MQSHIREPRLRNIHVHRLEATPLSFSHREHSRTFRIAGLTEWNKPTFNLREITYTTFKAKLITYLFQ